MKSFSLGIQVEALQLSYRQLICFIKSFKRVNKVSNPMIEKIVLRKHKHLIDIILTGLSN